MSSLKEELTTRRKADLENRLRKLKAEMLVVEVELAIFNGQPIRINGTRERVIGELLNGPSAIPELAEKLNITRGNAHATIWRLHKAGVVKIVNTEKRGHGTATNIWDLVRY